MKFSVIVPVYNSSRYLRGCLSSICAQTYTNFEIVLVNDGSTDDSSAICHEFAAKDNRIRVIDQTNGGVSKARNTGITAARGDWLMFVDSDDTVRPGYLAAANEILKQMAFDPRAMVISGFEVVGHGSTVVFRDEIHGGRETVRRAFLDRTLYRWGYPFGKTYNREKVIELGLNFDGRIKYSEDLLFFMRYLAHVEKLRSLPTMGYQYHVREEMSLSKGYSHYEAEYLFYSLFRSHSIELVGAASIDRALHVRLGEMLDRAISCMYRPSTLLPRARRLAELRRISEEDGAYLDVRAPFLPKVLLRYGAFRTFDLVARAAFWLRYGLFFSVWRAYRVSKRPRVAFGVGCEHMAPSCGGDKIKV